MAWRTVDSITSACELFLTTSDQSKREAADEFLRQFKSSSAPYEVAFQVLQQSQNHFCQLISLTAIKDALVREWIELNRENIMEIKNMIIKFSTSRELSAAVFNTCLSVVCVIYKRDWCPLIFVSKQADMDYYKVRSLEWLSQMDHFLSSSPSFSLKWIANNLIEFNARTSTGLGVSWDYHTRCHRSFETEVLPTIFIRLVQLFTQNSSENLLEILECIKQILSWEFDENLSANKMALSLLNNQFEPSPYIFPGPSWRDTLIFSDFTTILFSLNTSSDVRVFAIWRKCLIQLACVSGKIYKDDSDKKYYLSRLFPGIVNLIKLFQTDIMDAELFLFDLIELLKRLVLNFKLPLLAEALENKANMFTFLNLISSLTNFVTTMSQNEDDNQEWLTEALDLLFELWGLFVSQFELYEKVLDLEFCSCLESESFTIFKTYVTTFISSINNQYSETKVNWIDKAVESNIQNVSIAGRLSSLSSLATLKEMLNSSVQNGSKVITEKLLGFIGYLIADEGEGEEPSIPKLLMHVSFSNYSNTKRNINLSDDDVISASIQSDPIVSILDIILNFLHYDNQQLTTLKSFDTMSSDNSLLLVRSIWFLNRFCGTYLFLKESLYEFISPSLLYCFGDLKCERVHMVLNLCLRRIDLCLFHLTSLHEVPYYSDLMEQCCNLVGTFLRDSKIRMFIMSNTDWLQIISKLIHPSTLSISSKLSTIILAKLFKSVCISVGESSTETLVAFANMSNLEGIGREQVFAYITSSMNQSLNELFAEIKQRLLVNGTLSYENFAVLNRLLGILSGFCCASGTNTVHLKYSFLVNWLHVFVDLIPSFSSNPTLLIENKEYFNMTFAAVSSIIQLFFDIADVDISYLNKDESLHYFQTCISLVTNFGNYAQVCSNSRLCDNEENWILLLRILLHIVSKDAIDFSSDVITFASDAAFAGVSKLLPHLTQDLLDYPDIIKCYYGLVTELVSCYPKKFLSMSVESYHIVLNSLKFGLNHVIPGVNCASLNCLFQLALFYLRSKTGHPLTDPLPTDLDHMLKNELNGFQQILLQLLLIGKCSSDINDQLSDALIALINCDQAAFYSAVTGVVQSNLTISSRLQSSFEQLLTSNGFVINALDRKTRFAFRKRLMQFLLDVKVLTSFK